MRHYLVEHVRYRQSLLRRQVRVPEVEQEHDAIRARLVPDVVGVRVVEEHGVAGLPADCFVAHLGVRVHIHGEGGA